MRVIARRQRHRKGCTAACVEIVTRACGSPVTESQLIAELGGPRSFGICTVKLAKYLAVQRFRVQCFSQTRRGAPLRLAVPSEALLEKCLHIGAFPIVTLDPSLLRTARPSRQFHAVLVTRLTRTRCEYIDPALGRRVSLSMPRFIRAWSICAKRASAHLLVMMDASSGAIRLPRIRGARQSK